MQSDFRENLHLALDTVREHKLRSFLAILGVMIGVALIILVVGLVQGFRQTIQDEIVSEGIDTAFVSRFDQGPQNGRRPKDEKLRKPLTLEDAIAVRQLCPAIKEIAVSAFQWQLSHTARYQGVTIEGTDFRGTFPAYLTVYSNATMKAAVSSPKPKTNIAKMSWSSVKTSPPLFSPVLKTPWARKSWWMVRPIR